MCALELLYPDIGPVEDQFLLGEHLLVAPVLEPGCTARRVVLPEGHWLDLFIPGQEWTGPTTVEIPVGPDDVPVFVRAGAVLALLPDDVFSLSPYTPAVPDRRGVRAFPSGTDELWSGPIGPELSGRAEGAAGRWTLQLEASRSFDWDISVRLPCPLGEVEAPAPWAVEHDELCCSVVGESVSLSVRWDC